MNGFCVLVEKQNCQAQCWLKGLHILPLAAHGSVLPCTRAEFISLSFFIVLFLFFPLLVISSLLQVVGRVQRKSLIVSFNCRTAWDNKVLETLGFERRHFNWRFTDLLVLSLCCTLPPVSNVPAAGLKKRYWTHPNSKSLLLKFLWHEGRALLELFHCVV